MSTYAKALLTGSCLVLAVKVWSAGPDPEPPPPITVSQVRGAGDIEVKSARKGLVLTVERGPGRGTCYFTMTLAKKASPGRIAMRFLDVSNLTRFTLYGQGRGERFRLNLSSPQGKQTYHLDANGRPVASSKRARLTVTFEPKRGYVEVAATRHKGQIWPAGPMRVSWRAQ